MSRYSHPCPACGACFFASQVKEKDSGWFRCPACGEWLEYDYKHALSTWVISILLALVLSWRLGYRDADFILAATIATMLLAAAGFFLGGIFAPCGYKRVETGSSKAFEHHTSLHLNDRPDNGTKKP
jgi:hypothetical protein